MNLGLVCLKILEGYLYGEQLVQKIDSSIHRRFTATETQLWYGREFRLAVVLLVLFLLAESYTRNVSEPDRIARNFLEKHNILVLDWSAQSPFLNHIEHTWGMLQLREFVSKNVRWLYPSDKIETLWKKLRSSWPVYVSNDWQAHPSSFFLLLNNVVAHHHANKILFHLEWEGFFRSLYD